MTYRRHKSGVALSKIDKVGLMSEYVAYCQGLVGEDRLGALDVKIPREVFAPLLDQIGTLLNEQATAQSKEGPVNEFLDANPLPPHTQGMRPDDFRALPPMLNTLKQWVLAESATTDRYLLGAAARQTCRVASTRCIVTEEELGEGAKIHHPLRDGRPPILLSKRGHDCVEQAQQMGAEQADMPDDSTWSRVCVLKKERRVSWVQLREGCGAVSCESGTSRAGARSFANAVIRETRLTASDVMAMLDARGGPAANSVGGEGRGP
jgi:hypothetical protein